MTTPLETALGKLTEIQRRAVDWNQDALLVLAGPGSGKTQVLTSRIARLLDSSRDKNFRILALTFTNKAADEMKKRVADFVPGLEDRANIGTFHSFCGQILRQHGVHLGIKPDFAIYAGDDDRRAVLADALRRAASEQRAVSADDVRYLPLIDWMKARLVEPNGAEKALVGVEDRSHVALVYRVYEDELRSLNALDFNSLILEAHRLASQFPAIAGRYRKSHPYWLIDEFQDTNGAQYRLMRALAGDSFRNIFAVADDDQIIYQWNGASFRQIQSFLQDFTAQLLQLPTNYRCPPAIVEAANRLVAYNAERTTSKKPLLAGKTELLFPSAEHIQLRTFPSDEEEAAGIAREIAGLAKASWGQVAVLGRNRALLERMHKALQATPAPSAIAQRRDDFLSAEFRWLGAVLQQVVRPLDRRNIAVLIEAFNRFASGTIAPAQIITEAETTGRSYLVTWLETIKLQALGTRATRVLAALAPAVADPLSMKLAIESIVAEFSQTLTGNEGDSDLAEDAAAWRELSRDIAWQIGKNAPLDQFLQQLELRSKEPTPKPGTVTLTTVHAAKGKEFDIVYVVGLAEDVMPSFQSRQKGDKSPEMEEERRSCFVAITRTRERLVLSCAERYRGWQKQPSRFLVEMGLINTKRRA